MPHGSPDDLRGRLIDALGRNAANLVLRDRGGHARLLTTPPMRRASMAPRPLPPLSWRHPWDWLRRRFATDPSINAPVPDAGPRAPEPWRAAAHWRRFVFLVLVAAQTAFGTWLGLAVLPYHGRHWLEPPILALSAVLLAWVSAGFWMALMGFWVLVRGGDRHAPSLGAAAGIRIPRTARTAILVPIYNENVRRVFAGVQATFESLLQTGQHGRFDFYVLSDSTDADARAAEVTAWTALCRAVSGYGQIFYRHRRLRIKRKSGNIADWCRRWGRDYRYMVVLDADSVMSGACLVRLVQLMEAHPGAGIIQTVAMPTGRDTLYARMQQFAHRAYAPLFTAGLHYWHLGEAYYWGHNAILRVEPFMRHCALPTLRRGGPLGGEILSHDFVEAALMRRAGWHVWVVYDLPGSWEEMPPTLLEELRRDRRWCHGNLQHSRLFLAQGLHPAHRALFMAGVMSYVSSLLWLLFLALSTALLAVHVLVPPVYFTQPFQLYPLWPQWRPHWALALLGMTTALLLTPKLLATMLLTSGGAQGFGGRRRLADSVLLEMLASSLLAPIRMLFHARFVLAALLGLAPRWISPPRDNTETSWGEALRRHGGGTLVGIAWIAGVAWLNPAFLGWLLPVAGSLVIAIPLSVWTSRVRLGTAFRARGLFVTPEESAPPPELARLRRIVSGATPDRGAFARAALESAPNALAIGIAPPRPRLQERIREERRTLVQRGLNHGPQALAEHERGGLLGDREAMAQLYRQLQARPKARERWQAAAQ